MIRLYSSRVSKLSLSASVSFLMLRAVSSCFYFSIVYTLELYKQFEVILANLAFTLVTMKVFGARLLVIQTLQLFLCLLVPLMKLFKLVVHHFLHFYFVLDKHATQIINNLLIVLDYLLVTKHKFMFSLNILTSMQTLT